MKRVVLISIPCQGLCFANHTDRCPSQTLAHPPQPALRASPTRTQGRWLVSARFPLMLLGMVLSAGFEGRWIFAELDVFLIEWAKGPTNLCTCMVCKVVGISKDPWIDLCWEMTLTEDEEMLVGCPIKELYQKSKACLSPTTDFERVNIFMKLLESRKFYCLCIWSRCHHLLQITEA